MKIIKRNLFYFVMIFLIIVLTSCYIKDDMGKRRNKMIPGYFEGYEVIENYTDIDVDGLDYSNVCTLTVKEISREEFETSNGINTVFDCIGEKYYYILFTTKKDGEEKITYEFRNLKDAHNGAKHCPIDYCDDFDNWIKPPLTSDDVYDVAIRKEEKYINFILYWRETNE